MLPINHHMLSSSFRWEKYMKINKFLNKNPSHSAQQDFQILLVGLLPAIWADTPQILGDLVSISIFFFFLVVGIRTCFHIYYRVSLLISLWWFWSPVKGIMISAIWVCFFPTASLVTSNPFHRYNAYSICYYLCCSHYVECARRFGLITLTGVWLWIFLYLVSVFSDLQFKVLCFVGVPLLYRSLLWCFGDM